MEKSKKIILGIIIASITLVLSSINTILNFIADYQWFRELSYERVFLTKLFTQIRIGVPLFALFTIFIYLYFLTLKKDYYKKIVNVYKGVEEKRINQIAFLGAIIAAFAVSTRIAGSLWFDILQYVNRTPFDVNDPIFNKDVSFYIFQYPFYNKIYYMLISFLFIMALLTIGFYIVLITLRRPTIIYANSEEEILSGFNRINVNLGHGKRLIKIAVRQLIFLGVTFFIILALGYYLKGYDLLYSPTGVVFGAGYTDVKVKLIVYRVLMVLSLVSAIILVYGMKKGRGKIALVGPALMIAVSILGNIVAGLVQNYIVSPDEISKERPYIENSIAFTQKAYGLDNVKEEEFPANLTLTREDIENNRETIANIRINDYRPAQSVYNQKQGIRYYYNFTDVDIDRYYIDGVYRQVFISARELDQSKISGDVLTFINKHLKYTHGYGVVMSPVNEAVEGLPRMLIENIPPVTSIEGLKIDRPEIYFGELTDDFIIVNTKEKEFDYPHGESNVETIYNGTGGIRLNGFNRLLHSYTQRSLKMLLSGNITGESRIILHRNINDRVRKIMPYLEYDPDPYIVLSEGKLYWIIDAFTISNRYPYSKPLKDLDLNYIRNSVKVVIDAYNGKVTYYIADKEDPLINTYRKIFPQLFTDIENMSEDLKSHIRYSQTLFDIQSEIYRIYHMEDPVVFYNSEDEWHIARELYEVKEEVVESTYFIMKLPKEEKEEFVLALPYTPKDKKNLTALLIGRNDGENYGKLVVYKLPKNRSVYGPMQIENKIDSDDVITKEFSLWSQRGSRVIRGNVLTIPIEDSLLYVEPIYLQANTENSLPEVKRVIVGYGEQMVMEPTLEEALDKIFGAPAEKEEEEEIDDELGPIEEEEVLEEDIYYLIKRANDVFNRSQEAIASGNWAEYGRLMEELKGILEKLGDFKNSLE